MSNHDPRSLEEEINAWLASKPIRPNTERAYRLELDRLQEWASINRLATDATRLSKFEMADFLRWISRSYTANHSGELPQRSSLQQTKRIVGAFLKDWAKRRRVAAQERWTVGAAEFDEIAGPASEESAEVTTDRLVACGPALLVNGNGKDAEELRNQALANLAFWCCATTSELAALRIGDVSRNCERVLIDGGGSREREMSVPAHLALLLKSYMSRNITKGKTKQTAFLFPGQGAEKLSASTIRKCVRRAINSEEIDASPRLLRRAFSALAYPQSLPVSGLVFRLGTAEIRTPPKGDDYSSVALAQLIKSLRTLAASP